MAHRITLKRIGKIIEVFVFFQHQLSSPSTRQKSPILQVKVLLSLIIFFLLWIYYGNKFGNSCEQFWLSSVKNTGIDESYSSSFRLNLRFMSKQPYSKPRKGFCILFNAFSDISSAHAFFLDMAILPFFAMWMHFWKADGLFIGKVTFF